MKLTKKTLAKYIDHTLLKPQATSNQIISLCKEAKQYGFASVCVNSCYASLVSSELRDTDVATCCVIGFPLGACSTDVKAYEADSAVRSGAEEIDMVVNVGAVKEGKWAYVESDIEAVVKAIDGRAKLKVIIEACLLTDEEKKLACQAAVSAGADFVKTSTGFSTGGATVADVRLMRETVGPEVGVKAAGGVRTYEEAIALIEAGASRLGASAGVRIISGIDE